MGTRQRHAHDDRLKVLLITDRAPGADSGYGLRVRNVINGLARVGDLHVCLIDHSDVGVVLNATEQYDSTVIRAKSPSRLRKALTFLSKSPSGVPYVDATHIRSQIAARIGDVEWDAIWCSRARVHIVSQFVSGPRIVDFDDLSDHLLITAIRDRGARHGWLRTLPHNLFDLIDAARWNLLQRQIMANVDRVAICSSADEQRLRKPNVAVVKNGYPEPAHSSGHDGVDTGLPSLLFVGPLTYEPNQLAVEWLLEEVMPLIRSLGVPDCELVVVGENRRVKLLASDTSRARFEGWVEDVGPYYEQASVAVTPLHSGGGTRLKVIEALARRVPLVSTTFGCRGLDLVSGTELLVADDARDYAEACIALITDGALRERLIDAGSRRYEAEFTSEAVARSVQQLATELAGSSATVCDRS